MNPVEKDKILREYDRLCLKLTLLANGHREDPDHTILIEAKEKLVDARRILELDLRLAE